MSDGGAREVLLARPPGGPVPWLVGAGVAALALLAVAASSGSVDIIASGPRGSAPSVSLAGPTVNTSTTTLPVGDSSLPLDTSQLPDLPPVVVAALRLLVVGLVAWGLYLLLRLLWQHLPRWQTRVVPAGAVQTLPSLPDELLDTADARLALLYQGPPGNAIVACWVDLEDAATSAGLPRRPAETSAEYTVRVLHTWDIAPDAMGRLAELYREARHSTHQLTEEHRSEAIRRLEAIHDDLRRVVAQDRETTQGLTP